MKASGLHVLLAAVALLLAPYITHAQRSPLAGEQRVALVIGNSTYTEAPLRNAVNDATDIAHVLRELDFTVTLRTNATHKEMEQAIQQFGAAIRRGGVGLFYFSGHGIQSRGGNFLIPVGTTIQSEADLKFQAVDAGWVLAQMEDARNRVNIVILDSCRNNPYVRSFRSATRGLAQMDAAKGSFLAFATAPGDVAADGAGRNSPYTRHLLASLRHQDSDIFQVFSRVGQAVAQETKEQQIPWFNSSLIGRFQFSTGSQPAATTPSIGATSPADSAVELAFWDTIKSSTNRADFEEYLRQYPNGRFGGLARNRVQSLNPPPTQIATIAPSGTVSSPAPIRRDIDAVSHVNGAPVPRVVYERVLKSQVAQGQPPGPELEKKVREELINRQLLVQAAAKLGLGTAPDPSKLGSEVEIQLYLTHSELLFSEYLRDYLRKNPVTDDAVKKEYERLKPQLPAREYRSHHILVEKEDEARRLIMRIRQGASFEKLASEYSKDQGSKSKGGELDWSPAERYVKAFGDALTKLRKGELAEVPVQTQFGWHVIRLDDERSTKVPTFEEAKPHLQQKMQNEVIQKLVADLRVKAKIE